MTNFRSKVNPFDIRDNRAMVSLGALNKKRHCTYSCPFCYVQSDFLSYPNFSISEIIEWLSKSSNDPFDIVYLSGDTDSFAPPRTNQALQLLEELQTIGKDVLFTTRMVLDNSSLNKLGNLVEGYRKQSLKVYGCVSVAQKSVPILEPAPISPPIDRIMQLQRFKDLGLITILAIRPFIPIVPLSDYKWILEESYKSVHAVLGENWYFDQEGFLETKVLGPSKKVEDYTLTKMPFDCNEAIWKVYNGIHIQKFIEDWCQLANLPFYMRSKPAIEWIRSNII